MRLKLKTKAAFVIIIIALILSATSITISSRIIRKIIDSNYNDKANSVSLMVSRIIDKTKIVQIKSEIDKIYNSLENKVMSDQWGTPEFDRYLSNYAQVERSPVFRALTNMLHYAQNTAKVKSVYLLYINKENKHCIYIADASDEPCPPGCIDYLGIHKDNLRVLNNPELGFPPYISRTKEYGWLVTAGVPVYDVNGSVLCYAMVDISMDEVRARQRNFLIAFSLILFVITLMICGLAILVVNHAVTKPISRITKAAVQYCQEDSENEKDRFSHLNIHTGDEIEELADSMKKMERDLNSHIRTILSTMHELTLTRKKADEMSALAHKDGLTGLRNKTAFDKEAKRIDQGIPEGKTEFGIVMIDLNFLKVINDNYGHDKGNVSLIKLCQIICEVFDHSPVFRIGGDEFVVLIENTDYKNVENLERQMNDRLAKLATDASLKTWERVSAAIGVALFDPKLDNSVDSVFKRADDLMYEHKKEMKKIRM